MKKFKDFVDEVDDVRVLIESDYEDDGRSIEEQEQERLEYVRDRYQEFQSMIEEGFDYDNDDYDAVYEMLEESLRKINIFVEER